MANKKSECRELCEKYTTLREEEMEEIYPFLDDLQYLADREQSNVYIDCMTYTGKSMVIVGEAFPGSTGTIYTEPLFGKIMYTKNEPAVARTFATGIPTKNVTGEEVISSRIMIQQVYPIKHDGKTVAVLIYEKLYDKPQGEDETGLAERKDLAALVNNIEKVVDHFKEGLILVDKDENICYYNDFVKGVFKELGYVGRIFGMEIQNIFGNDSEGNYRFQMRDHTLSVRIMDISEGDVKYAVLIDDVTKEEQLIETAKDIEFRLHEERHSQKNALLFLMEHAESRADASSSPEAQAAYREMRDRIGMLQSVMELTLQREDRIGVKDALEYVFRNKLDLVTADKNVELDISGDDVVVREETINTVISVVYELICNSLKHAFKEGEGGRISIKIEKGYLASSITYTDDGAGFDPEKVPEGTNGLGIIETLVRDKLSGVLKIKSEAGEGTEVFFDFIE